MVRGGEVSRKRKFKTRVRSKGNDSDDSDEDYVVSDEGNEISACSEEDYGSSVDGEASDASFDSFAEEEKERKVRRKVNKVGKKKQSKCSGRFKREEDDEYELEEEEEEEEEEDDDDEDWDEVKMTGRSKVLGGFSGRQRNRVVHSKIKEEEEEEFEDEDRAKVKTTGRSKGQGGFSRLQKNGVIHCTKKDEEEEVEEGDEEKDGVGAISRSKVQGGFARLRNNSVIHCNKDDDDYEEEEEEEEDVDEGEDGVKVISGSKVQGGSLCMQRNRVVHSQRKRVPYKEDDENDDDDEEFTPSNDDEEEEDDDDEDFTADDDDDYLDEEESNVKRKKNKKKVGKRVLRKKGSVRCRRRRSKSMTSKKPKRKKARKTRGFKRKVGSDNDCDFVDNGHVLKEKGEMKTGPKRRRFVVDSDSDFAPSPSNEYEYTISEEEREQVKEAKEFCRMKPDLKSSSTSDKIQEVGVLQPERKPKVRKGKEKVEEEVRAEVAKKVCGICLSEEDKRRVRGILSCCTHYFCFTCIREWAKVESRCPLCKQRFNTITKCTRSKAVIDFKDTIQVPERDQVYQPTEEELRSFLYPYEDVLCFICHQGGHDDLMLLCDECDSSAHTFCIGLGNEVPEGSWYCHDCKPLAPESPNSLPPTHLSDQRTTSNNMTHRASTITNNAIEGFDLNSVSHGVEALPSPRQFIGGFQATVPFSRAGASTVSSRMRLQHHVQQCLSERADRPEGTSPNSQSDQGRESMIQRTSALFSEERFRENTFPAMRETHLLPPSVSQSRRQIGQDPFTIFPGVANGAMWPGVAERNSLPAYQQQLRQFNSGSNSACDREEFNFQTAKGQLKLMVKTHVKNLSRTIELAHPCLVFLCSAQSKLEEIAKVSTQTILAACELDQWSNKVAPPPNCDHREAILDGQVSLWRGCCSSCFDSFVSDVVKKILDAKLSEERRSLNLNLAL